MGFGSSSQQSTNQSNQSSQSYNQAYPTLSSAFGDQVGYTGKANGMISKMLGLDGSAAQTEGFDNYRKNSGFDFIQSEGTKAATASRAAKGLLHSGDTIKAISKYNTNLASTFLDKYLSQLFGLSDQGIKAGQVLAAGGNTASSQGTSYGNSSGSSFNASLG